MRRLLGSMLLTGLLACGGPQRVQPAGPAPDVGVADPEEHEDARGDAAPADAEEPASPDAAELDAGALDAGALDAGARDAARPDAVWQPPPRALCGGAYRLESPRARLEGTDLVEVSGVATSLLDPEVLWMHNDSGDAARLFAVGTDGRRLGELLLPEVAGVDLEDVAAAPCPDGSGPCLWIADTGDNQRARSDATVYAVPEPRVSASAPLVDAVAAATWSFPVRYPDGPVDVEALFVAPDASAFFLIEKAETAEVRLFRVSALPGASDEAVELARFAAPGVDISMGRLVTGADLHPSGRALAVRVYTGVYEYRVSGVEELARLGALVPQLVALGPFSERQGEAVAYDGTGLGLWTVSEDPRRRGGQPLNHHACE
jgi:hypothetical protein